MHRNVIKTVLQSLLALALVAMVFEGTQRLRHQDPPHPAPVAEATDETDTPAAADHHASLPASPAKSGGGGDIGSWRPDVDQVIDQLEDILISDIPQQQMNYTMANLDAVYDTKLYLVFIDYLASLSPDQVKVALKEQQDWLLARKEETAKAYAENEDASLASYNAGETYLQTTRQRLDDLEKKLPQ